MNKYNEIMDMKREFVAANVSKLIFQVKFLNTDLTIYTGSILWKGCILIQTGLKTDISF